MATVYTCYEVKKGESQAPHVPLSGVVGARTLVVVVKVFAAPVQTVAKSCSEDTTIEP